MPRLTTASLSFAVACVSLVGISPSDSTGVGAQEPTPYEVAATQNVMVRMRDGVHLATDIYRPARNGSPVEGTFPVLLERTPYNKEIENPDGTLSPVDPVTESAFPGKPSGQLSGVTRVRRRHSGRARSIRFRRALANVGRRRQRRF